jgi:hypothetical protein
MADTVREPTLPWNRFQFPARMIGPWTVCSRGPERHLIHRGTDCRIAVAAMALFVVIGASTGTRLPVGKRRLPLRALPSPFKLIRGIVRKIDSPRPNCAQHMKKHAQTIEISY